jgi:hypothetical protein
MKTALYCIVLLVAFHVTAQKNDVASNNYWTQGKAEINVYELSQNRYKENHPGHAISIFVTEDFLTDKQVKNERYKNPNSTWILKNIQLRKFTTGIYDYSMFTSVFTPIDRTKFPKSLKVTGTSQEWCGTIFTQLNYRNNKYQYQLRSYFEKEGDQNGTLQDGILEDELFTVLRMNPAFLPKGNFKLIPGTMYSQLKHSQLTPVNARAMISAYNKDDLPGGNLQEYKVEIPSQNRTLRIVYENVAPYKIVAWFDTYPSAFDGKLRTTKAVLKKQKMLAYWGQNSLQDAKLRKELGLN